ncbi:NAD(P)/FAD-dependent oxidoreductase [Rhizobium sp. SG2393]|uniref:NAD(P)/FAD-dependent oxidoreductase n=1 Tax=Rhizobium sp. SG2393 TaxID=3276279 RepID=UPI003670A758
MVKQHDIVIIGAGAAGMMCAVEAARRGRSVLVIDHAKAPGEKIRISGGGRCNFTNIHCSPKNFLSANPHFAKSALARYTPQDFIARLAGHGIAWHEKTLGQLFCDDSARQIVDMFVAEMREAGAELRLATAVEQVEARDGRFHLRLADGVVTAESLVVATGGKSIPKMGATGYAYRLAEQFGLAVTETRPGLVPLTLDPARLADWAPLAGLALPVTARAAKASFREAMLFTHRGLSGPAILQASSYWREGEDVFLDIAPDIDLAEGLRQAKKANGRQTPLTALSDLLPRRFAEWVAADAGLPQKPLADMPDRALEALAARLRPLAVRPAGSEGYRTAEVTLGGVDTAGLDSRTLQAKAVPGLFFIGECVDVTGWLGGYNFQWAWASGHAAGQAA